MIYNDITITCIIGNFSRNGGSAGSTNVEKPLSRGFDVNSLIGNTDDKDDDRDRGSPGSPRDGGTLSPPHKSSSGREMSTTPTYPSPNLSVGPPAPPAPPQSSLYPFLLHPGLYQHLANAGLASGNPNMLLNAQLALMAQQNPMLASAYAQLNAAHAAQSAAHTSTASHPLLSSSDRLRQSHRFSPYSFPPPPPSVGSTGSPASSPNPPSSHPISTPVTTVNNGSAFHSIIPRNSSTSSTSALSNSPPPSSTSNLSVASTNTTTSVSSNLAPSRVAPFQETNSTEVVKKVSSRSPSPAINHQKSQIENTTSAVLASRPNANDIKSMENLVNGLNGSSSSKFGISHSEVGGEVSTS